MKIYQWHLNFLLSVWQSNYSSSPSSQTILHFLPSHLATQSLSHSGRTLSWSCSYLPLTTFSFKSYFQDSIWKKIEDENPSLFSEAISRVASEICDKHEDCIKKGANRYETEIGRKEYNRKKYLLKKFRQWIWAENSLETNRSICDILIFFRK